MKHYLVGIRLKSDISDKAYHPYATAKTEEEAIKAATDVLTHRDEVISARVTLRESTTIRIYNKDTIPGEEP